MLGATLHTTHRAEATKIMCKQCVLLLVITAVTFTGCQQASEPAASPAASASATAASTAATSTTSPAKTRQVRFHYRFRVKDLASLAATGSDAERNLVRIWLPCAVSGEHQQIKRLEIASAVQFRETREKRYGNALLYGEVPLPASGEFAVDVPYEVTRSEVTSSAAQPQPLDDAQRQLFLGENALVPTGGKAAEMLKALTLNKDQLALARQLYDVVDEHCVYKKEGTGWGRGDTNWVCDNGYGNCTDFHSLFMSLARSQGLPARFEIGFSLPTDKPSGPVAGYHCWAWFYVNDRGWIPVDISEADKHPQLKEYYFGNLTADRVTFSVGRDLQLDPPTKHEPLNFMVYPHIEVGGEKLPATNIELQFAYENLP